MARATANGSSTMPASTRIDQLHLRVLRMSREQAGRLGAAVAEQLARELSAVRRPGNLNTLHLRLAIPPGTPRDRLSSVIAAGIAQRIS